MDLNSVLVMLGMAGTIVVQIIVLAVAFGVGKQILSGLIDDVRAIREKLMDGPGCLVEMVTRHDERISTLEEAHK